ncbi:MAG: hypothetical protein AAGC81_17605 [Pseudomonadota bacterium]
MNQAAVVYCLPFGPFALVQDRLAATERDIDQGEVSQALEVARSMVVPDGGTDVRLQVARQAVVFLRDSVLWGLGLTRNLTLPVSGQ